jgi:branched-chain amino acid transport system permease protein
MDVVGGPRAIAGSQVTRLCFDLLIVAITIYVVVSLINSTYGRGFHGARRRSRRKQLELANALQSDRARAGRFFAGIAGILRSQHNAHQSERIDFHPSIEIVVIVILGGMGSTAGVTFAAILLTLLLEYLVLFQHSTPPEIIRRIAANRVIIYSLVLIALHAIASARVSVSCREGDSPSAAQGSSEPNCRPRRLN